MRPGGETGETGRHAMTQRGRGGRCRPRSLGAWPRGTAAPAGLYVCSWHRAAQGRTGLMIRCAVLPGKTQRWRSAPSPSTCTCCTAESGRIHIKRRRCAAPGPGAPAPSLALASPGAPAPSHRRRHRRSAVIRRAAQCSCTPSSPAPIVPLGSMDGVPMPAPRLNAVTAVADFRRSLATAWLQAATGD